MTNYIPECDFHHCLPTSRLGNREWINKIRIVKRVHQRIHHLFENRTPKEQIEFILDLNAPVIERKVRHAIRDIIENEDMMYKDWVWIYK